VADLGSTDARIRYETVGGLRYVNDPALASHVKPLLRDTGDVQAVGSERSRRYRRVCDEAVDTLAFLLKLKLPFPIGEDMIYSDEQLHHVRDVTR